ncbi:unnamed protein product [Protopolystoma xenopodis]|uniref:Uncharacterized protein n=1 Tax=Protopolystoma xenopodis TaxID=117903 RepID=A0A448WNB2_9PLAT|nr:unnamed protein product [Protopolystoma xenopodis]
MALGPLVTRGLAYIVRFCQRRCNSDHLSSEFPMGATLRHLSRQDRLGKSTCLESGRAICHRLARLPALFAAAFHGKGCMSSQNDFHLSPTCSLGARVTCAATTLNQQAVGDSDHATKSDAAVVDVPSLELGLLLARSTGSACDSSSEQLVARASEVSKNDNFTRPRACTPSTMTSHFDIMMPTMQQEPHQQIAYHLMPSNKMVSDTSSSYPSQQADCNLTNTSQTFSSASKPNYCPLLNTHNVKPISSACRNNSNYNTNIDTFTSELSSLPAMIDANVDNNGASHISKAVAQGVLNLGLTQSLPFSIESGLDASFQSAVIHENQRFSLSDRLMPTLPELVEFSGAISLADPGSNAFSCRIYINFFCCNCRVILYRRWY